MFGLTGFVESHSRAATAYDRKRLAEAERQRRNASAKREVGEIPPVADPERRATAVESLLAFCNTYFPRLFYLSFSAIHLRIIEKLERTVTKGDKFALAMPRSYGKTSLVRAACLWAALTGKHKYVLLVCATGVDSAKSIQAIKALLTSSPLLEADFPEVLYPISKLEGVAQRARGQTYRGRPTNVVWSKSFVQFPDIAGSAASGCIIDVASLSGHIRGRNVTLPDGSAARPTLVILDDPQTKQSARHKLQTDFRESVILGDVGGLAPPDKPAATIMLCTVICTNDLSERFLNRDKHPTWRGERYKLMTTWPTAVTLWDKYREIRERCLRADQETDEATEHYRQNQTAMDAGGDPSWPERFEPGQLSAIQYAYDKLYELGDVEFNSEFQNEPIIQSQSDRQKLTEKVIMAKVIDVDRGVAPDFVEKVTCFVDVQERVLFWMICGWSMNFTGHVIDYGVYPDQPVSSFSARNARITLKMKHQGGGIEAAIYGGLEKLVGDVLDLKIERRDGTILNVDRVMIDSGDNAKTIYRFFENHERRAKLRPTKGRFIGPAERPYTEYQRRDNERLGPFWIDRPLQSQPKVRLVTFDSNEAKNLAAKLIENGKADAATLTIFKGDFHTHRMLLDHWTAESPVDVTAKGVTKTIWKNELRAENHFWDTLDGNVLAASFEGVSEIVKRNAAPKKPRKTIQAEYF